jgi:hypothetical protein
MDAEKIVMLQSFKELFAVCVLAEMKRVAVKASGAPTAPLAPVIYSNKNFEFF